MTLSRRPTPPVLHLEQFEGPLDLLLTLVERRRLPIAEMSLAAVADQYLAQVRSLSQLDPDLLSEFLAIAARLLLLKSRALLPAIEPPPSANVDDEADGAELVRRLQVYHAYRELAAALGQLEASGRTTFGHGAHPLELPPEAAALQPIPQALLLALYQAIEQRRSGPAVANDPDVVRTSVAERIALLRGRLTTERTIHWQAVCGTTVDEIVATLLAVLELVRRGEMEIVQSALFGPIQLQAAEPSVVRAGTDTGPEGVAPAE